MKSRLNDKILTSQEMVPNLTLADATRQSIASTRDLYAYRKGYITSLGLVDSLPFLLKQSNSTSGL